MIYNSDIYGQNIKTNKDYIFNNSININKLWEENTCNIISDLLKEDEDFVDIGANIGLISLGVIKMLKLKNKKIRNIHCFECNNLIFSFLNYNTNIHSNICLYNFAVSDKVELCNMSFNTYNNGCSCINLNINKDETTHHSYDFQQNSPLISENNIFIPALSLDEILYTFQNKVGVIKIDVEGFEYQVLNGAKIFLEKHKPIIIIEIFPEHFEKCNLLLESYNYFMSKKIEYQDYIYNYKE